MTIKALRKEDTHSASREEESSSRRTSINEQRAALMGRWCARAPIWAEAVARLAYRKIGRREAADARSDPTRSPLRKTLISN